MRRFAIIESLEPRRLLTATFNATAGDDSITLSVTNGVTHIIINGVDHTTADLSITVNAGAGNDTIQNERTRVGSNITVNGEGGDDLFENKFGFGSLHDVFAGNFLFDGGDGTD